METNCTSNSALRCAEKLPPSTMNSIICECKGLIDVVINNFLKPT